MNVDSLYTNDGLHASLEEDGSSTWDQYDYFASDMEDLKDIYAYV